MTDDRTMNELRAAAKSRGINTFQMSKEALIAALDGGTHDAPADPSPRTREERVSMKQPPLRALREEAKIEGIDSSGMTKDELLAALSVKDDEAEAQMEAEKVQRDSARARREAERPTVREDTGRRARVPLGDPRPKMAAPQRLGYHRRWINDAGDRLRAAEDAGYQFVEDEHEVDESGRGVRRSMTVGTKEDGSPLRAFLMEIRNEFYEADQAVKQAKIDEVDAAMRRGDVRGAQPQDQDKFYVPAEGIRVRS